MVPSIWWLSSQSLRNWSSYGRILITYWVRGWLAEVGAETPVHVSLHILMFLLRQAKHRSIYLKAHVQHMLGSLRNLWKTKSVSGMFHPETLRPKTLGVLQWDSPLSQTIKSRAFDETRQYIISRSWRLGLKNTSRDEAVITRIFSSWVYHW